MCHHIPWWSVGLLSFVEAEEAFNMNPGRDVHPKLSVKKTVVLLKILYYRIIESTCSWSTADGVDISTGWVKMISCEHLLMTKIDVHDGPPKSWPENEGLLMRRIKWKSEAHTVGVEFVCEAHSNTFCLQTMLLFFPICKGPAGAVRCMHQLCPIS